jgi:hypothetical protein
MILSSNWCFDPAMDHHHGDGNSLLHQVASCYIPATLNRSSFEGRGGLISQSRIGLNCHSRNEVKTLAAMGGSNSALGPAISINNHLQTTGKQTSLAPATLKKPFLILGGTAGAHFTVSSWS